MSHPSRNPNTDGIASVAALDQTETRAPLIERIAALRTKVESFVVKTPEDKAAVYRLRYRCYLREQAIEENISQTLSDGFDEHWRTVTMGLRLGTEIIASIRLHFLDVECAHSPTFMAFGDYVDCMLQDGHRIVDYSRFVIDHRASREHPELAYLVLRWPFAIGEYLEATKMLAAVRQEHMAFYARTLKFKVICTPRPYLKLIKPLGLMSVDYQSEKQDVFNRYPFFRPSTADIETFRFHGGERPALSSLLR